MKHSIKAIIFDIGGVLDKGDMQKHYIELCKELNIDFKHFKNVQREHHKLANSGKISTRQYISAMAKAMGIKHNTLLKKWIKHKKKNLQKDREVERVIKALKKRGYTVGSLTNVPEIHHKLRLEKKLYSPFDINVLSFKEGFRKPQKKIYQILVKRLNLKPKNILFVDDYDECIKPAKKMGMHTILFKNPVQLIKELKNLDLLI